MDEIEQPDQASTERRRIRVWFGEHTIADYTALAPLAERYAAAMSRRFAGCRVTNDPLPVVLPRDLPAPPAERLWQTLTP
ncbi:hypothetical protein [Kribbella deserti]|uniref:Uncharacterized protein n=1 Tax=Kribbella deserti TaxID=1926257 RepID=A0ABV6QGU8_9ACTN